MSPASSLFFPDLAFIRLRNYTEALKLSPKYRTNTLIATMSAKELTDDQLNAIVIIERVNSSLSVIGCVFIVVTFLSSSAFHKPINRLVFFASAGNIMTNIATLISRSALGNVNGALCQLQAFLIQMYSTSPLLATHI